MLGSVGVMVALMELGQWARVREIVSVSGGSSPNAALLALSPGSAAAGEAADAARLREFYSRLISKGAKAWVSWRRVGCVALMLLLIAGMVAAIVAASRVGAWLLVPVSLLAFPVALQLARRIVGAFFRDTIEAATNTRGVILADLHDPDAVRQHVFCATGLASAAPYYFWVGGASLLPADAPSLADADLSERSYHDDRWGVPIDPVRYREHTLGDVALASSSIPLIGTVRSPQLGRQDRTDGATKSPERLVDGGGSGLFGLQVSREGRVRVDDAVRGGVSQLPKVDEIAVDGFRHKIVKPGWKTTVGGFVRDHLSSMWFLVSYVQAASEALYVNDLADRDLTLVRLCTPDLAPTRHDAADDVAWKRAWSEVVERRHKAHLVAFADEGRSVAERLTCLREETAKIGLVGMKRSRADVAVTTGVVATYLARSAVYDARELDRVLRGASCRLTGDPKVFPNIWHDTKTCEVAPAPLVENADG